MKWEWCWRLVMKCAFYMTGNDCILQKSPLISFKSLKSFPQTFRVGKQTCCLDGIFYPVWKKTEGSWMEHLRPHFDSRCIFLEKCLREKPVVKWGNLHLNFAWEEAHRRIARSLLIKCSGRILLLATNKNFPSHFEQAKLLLLSTCIKRCKVHLTPSPRFHRE